ncbi:MAG TPA: penicillin-binding protein activator LpoB [Candidatus Omnitrophota bacterium]|nr:penicillin-binding protein activator LpoB [Candidatus Omnitrophota bacterium]
MNKHRTLFFSIIILSFCLSGCATKVERVKVDNKVDLSGVWNDYDAQLVSKETIADCLKASWLETFQKDQGRQPVVIVGSMANRSHEHINTQIFTKSLERELLNSGKVWFVASSEERKQMRGERKDQDLGFTDPATMAKKMKETGADYMLIGSLNSVKDAKKNQYVILYQVNLELVDISTNQKVWIGQKEIKKVVTNPKFSL